MLIKLINSRTLLFNLDEKRVLQRTRDALMKSIKLFSLYFY